MILSRLKNLLEKRGLRGTLREVTVRAQCSLRAFLCPDALLHPRRLRAHIRALFAGDFRRVILWRSDFGFHVPLYQRPQQMARKLAALGCLVLYEANPRLDGTTALRELEAGLLLFNGKSPLLRLLLRRELRRLDAPKTLLLYSADRTLSLRAVKRLRRRGWGVLYEYVDCLDPQISCTSRLPRRIAERFHYVMAHPEIPVAATAEVLRQDVLRRRGPERLSLVTNGVDVTFFRTWEPYVFEPAFQAILDRGKPIVCYYGALAAWLDYGLLRQIARSGRWSLVLIGVKYDGSFDRELRGTAGIDWLGPRDYAVLKYYARAADVLILPFQVSELTHATSPVKLFEYMALGRPIVSADLGECRRYQSVLRAQDRADFLRLLDEALRLRDDPSYLALLDREARDNDWREKAAALLRLMDDENTAEN